MHELESRDYPIREDMRFQRRSWLVERIGWAVLGIVLVAALAGLFGYGPASKANVGGPELRASYERFQRSTKTTAYVFHLGGNAGERELKLGPAFQTEYEVTDIQPHPVQSSGGSDGLTLKFSATPGELTIVIRARPRMIGSVTVPVAYGSERHSLWSFVYP